jgi:superfamily I DNA/RNA helicase
MFDEKHPCAITHDGYLKLFQLRQPQLQYQLVFLDEAQDTNQVLKALLTRQSAQKIWVGDQHQQIYSWRRASASLLGEPKQQYPLTQSFRFGQHIAQLANLLLQQTGEQRVVKGLATDYPVNTQFDPYAPYTVLCRTNAKVFEVAEFCIERKITFEINGGLDQVAKLIESAYALYKGKLAQVKVSDLAIFTSWQEFTQVADEAQKNEWKHIIKFVEAHRDQTLARIARLHRHCASGSQQMSQVFISTVHKAKGLGFEQVVLASDFEAPEADAEDYIEQLNVLYVAITRAKKVLKLPKALNQFFDQLAEKPANKPG